MIGVAFFVDEMNMHFKGHPADKVRMVDKAEVYGLQGDSLCQKVYTYQIFMYNDPPPKTYLDWSMSLLHSIAVDIFDNVEDKHHQCSMYDLHKSAAFFKAE